MAELRWVLLVLGVLVLIGVYVWGRGLVRRRERERSSRRDREEPHLSLEADLLAEPGSLSDERFDPRRPAPEVGPDAAGSRGGHAAERGRDEHAVGAKSANVKPTGAKAAGAKPSKAKPVPKGPPDKIVTIRFVPKSHELDGDAAVSALADAGLKHGRYGIFHMHAGEDDSETLFSVASLTEPGSFDLSNVGTIAGMSFFVALPGDADPVESFDAMVEIARRLARDLDADLFDDRGSSWSIQRERYVREELIRYRLQHAHS